MATIVVRAHNEQDTIADVVTALNACTDNAVWVAASGCTDQTIERARDAGAVVLGTPKGLGASTCTVLRHIVGDAVVFVDGDLGTVRTDVVDLLAAAAGHGYIGKGVLDQAGRSSALIPRIADELNVALPVMPPQALTSAYSSYPAGFCTLVDLDHVPADRGSDLMLSLLAHHAGIPTVLIPAGPRDHRDRGPRHIDTLIEGNRATLSLFTERVLTQ